MLNGGGDIFHWGHFGLGWGGTVHYDSVGGGGGNSNELCMREEEEQ